MPKHNSIKQRLGPRELITIATWLIDEYRELRDGAAPPPLSGLLLGADFFSADGAGIKALLHEDHRPRLFDAPIVAFLRLATAFTGSISLNRVGKGNGVRLYPHLVCYAGKEQGSRKSVRRNIPIDRLTIDAPVGRQVKERSSDYRDRRASNLIVADAERDTATKFIQGREDAIQAALEAYRYPRSSGLVLRKIGEILEAACRELATRAVPEIVMAKILRYGPHPSHHPHTSAAAE